MSKVQAKQPIDRVITTQLSKDVKCKFIYEPQMHGRILHQLIEFLHS